MWNGGGVTRKAARCLSNRAGAAPLGSLFAEVEESTAAALRRVLGADWAGAHDASGMVAVAGSRINADYQCNAALRLSKAAGRPPRTLATDIVTALRRDENASLLGSAEVAGPGFVNMKINDERLVSGVRRLARDGLPRHAFRAPGSPRNGLPHRGRRVLVDFASPNMAKVRLRWRRACTAAPLTGPVAPGTARGSHALQRHRGHIVSVPGVAWLRC